MQKARYSFLFAVVFLIVGLFQATHASADGASAGWRSYTVVAQYNVVQEVMAEFAGDPGISDRTKLRLYQYDTGVRQQMMKLADAVRENDRPAVRRLLPMAVGLLRAQVHVVSLDEDVDASLRTIERTVQQKSDQGTEPSPADWRQLTARIGEDGERIAAAATIVRQRLASVGRPTD